MFWANTHANSKSKAHLFMSPLLLVKRSILSNVSVKSFRGSRFRKISLRIFSVFCLAAERASTQNHTNRDKKTSEMAVQRLGYMGII